MPPTGSSPPACRWGSFRGDRLIRVLILAMAAGAACVAGNVGAEQKGGIFPWSYPVTSHRMDPDVWQCPQGRGGSTHGGRTRECTNSLAVDRTITSRRHALAGGHGPRSSPK